MTEGQSKSSPPERHGPAPEPDAAERRLHPLSWLFVLITQLRPLVLPAIVLLLFGRGDRWVFFGAIGALILSLYALVYSLSFRYRLADNELRVREGILNRTERHVPLARIHNVVQRRNPLHRLFGVTELRLESAGGSKPEAVMNVISLADADRLERLLRETSRHPETADAIATQAEVDVLHRLGFTEILRLGLASNRGLIVVAAIWGASMQLDVDWEELPLLSQASDQMSAIVSEFAGHHGVIELAASALIALLALIIVLRLLSIAMALVTFHGFRLERVDGRIVSESGLLTRTRAGATPRRMQRVVVRQSWLLARMRRVSIEVALAGAVAEQDKSNRLRWIAPIANIDAGRRLLGELRPEADWERTDWKPLDPRTARRLFKWPALIVLLACILAGLFWQSFWAFGALLLLPWLWLSARGRARFGGYALDAMSFAVREGWLSRRWDSVRLDDIQAVRIRTTPADRRRAMARVAVSSAGSQGVLGGALEVAYLPSAEAEALAGKLQRIVTRSVPASPHFVLL